MEDPLWHPVLTRVRGSCGEKSTFLPPDVG
uniref:Uncharacterized protein n=1 Tax=Astyanax mexicanus TaxID=7994 RepID=A0A3B1J0V5_ASTMX